MIKMEKKDGEMRTGGGIGEGGWKGKSGGGIHRGKRERQKGEKVSGKGVGRRGGLHVISLKVPMKVAHSKCREKQKDERHVTRPSRAVTKKCCFLCGLVV